MIRIFVIVLSSLTFAHSLFSQQDYFGVEEYKLENGFTVLLNPDPTATKVFGAVAVNTGSKNDPATATGLAHYLEHLLFKGTTELGTSDYEKEKPYIDSIFYYYDELAKFTEESKRDSIQKLINKHSVAASKFGLPNEFDNLLKSLGSTGVNAFTNEELTFYHNSFPANQIEKWLELYSHRFQNPVFRSFQSELEVVYEEKNRSMDNFQNQIFETLGQELFGEHPYGSQTTIGTVEHLKNPSLTKMYEYFKTWYVANNMALILTGNFNVDEVKPIIQKKFGKLNSGELPQKKSYNLKSFDKKVVVTDRITPVKVGVLGYKTIPNNHEDEAALELCVNLLTNTSQTGLIDQLSLNGEILFSFAFPLNYNEDGATLVIYAPKLLFQSFSKAEGLVTDAIHKLKTGDYDDELLEIVKKQIQQDYISQLEGTESRGYLIGMSFNQNRPWNNYVEMPNKINNLTKEDVRKVAAKYFKDNYLSFQSKTGFPKKSKLDKPEIESVVTDQKESSEYAKAFYQIPALEGAPKFIDFENDIKSANINGHEIYSTKNPLNNLYELNININLGSYENPILEGAVIMMDYAGTSELDKTAFKKELAKIGSTIQFSSDIDKVTIQLKGEDDKLEQAIIMLNKLLSNPVVEDKVLKSVIDGIKSDRKFTKKSPGTMGRVLNKYVMYGDRSEYLKQMSTKKAKKVSIEEYTNAIKELVANNQFTIHYSGNQSIDKFTEIFTKQIRLNPKPVLRNPFYLEPAKVEKTNITLLNDKKAVQSQIYFHVNGSTYSLEQYAALKAFNTYYSGGFSGLILQEIREYRSLAYSAGGRYGANALGKRGELITYVGCQADKTKDAIDIMMMLINEMPEYREREKLIKDNLVNSLFANYPSFRNLSEKIVSLKEEGFESDPNIQAFTDYSNLTFDDIVNFYEANIKGKPVAISIYGDAERIGLESLKELGEVIQVEIEDVIKL